MILAKCPKLFIGQAMPLWMNGCLSFNDSTKYTSAIGCLTKGIYIN